MDSWQNWRVAIDVSAADEIADEVADSLMECGTELSVSIGRKGTLRSVEVIAESTLVPEADLHKLVNASIASVAEKLTGYDALFATYWTEYGFAADQEEKLDNESDE